MTCPLAVCGREFSLDDCCTDGAVALQLQEAILKCPAAFCSWEGRGDEYEVRKQHQSFMHIARMFDLLLIGACEDMSKVAPQD